MDSISCRASSAATGPASNRTSRTAPNARTGMAISVCRAKARGAIVIRKWRGGFREGKRLRRYRSAAPATREISGLAPAARYNAGLPACAYRSRCMFTLVHLDTPPPESLKAQVLQMVVDYLSDLSPVSLTPSNALYLLYQYVVGFEVHRYLERMDDAQPGQPKLLLALDAEDPSQVLGFALYLTYLDDPQASALLYLAVLTRR